jgi:hypothetical protein
VRLGARRGVEAGGGGGGQRGEPAELLKVRGAERGASPRSGRGQLQPHQPPAVVVVVPADEAERFHPVGQLDRAVVADEQVGRQFADGRAGRVGMDAQHQQQLVLGRGQAGHGRLLLAPAEEPLQGHPGGEQVLVPPIVQRRLYTPSYETSWVDIIGPR